MPPPFRNGLSALFRLATRLSISIASAQTDAREVRARQILSQFVILEKGIVRRLQQDLRPARL